MSEPTVLPKRHQAMLGFYVASLLTLALVAVGMWLWTSWDNWQFDEDEARRRQIEAGRRLGLPVEEMVDLGDGVGIEMVLIPPGMFDMGSTDDAGPVHRVRLTRAFYIGRYEVTQDQWQKVMGANPSRFRGGNLPVIGISWSDCHVFLEKLNASGRAKGQFRLPTEAEWEWACRAGTRTRFCFGDDDAQLGEYAWYNANSGNRTHPVGEKKPNAWGLHDIHGNAWEWCADWFGRYEATPWPGVFRCKQDPKGPAAGPGIVLRGGAWNHPARDCRSARRFHCGFPVFQWNNRGLRVARSIAGQFPAVPVPDKTIGSEGEHKAKRDTTRPGTRGD